MSHTYLKPPTTPNLPYAPAEWAPRFQDQYSNVLRLYFAQLSNVFQQLSSPQGGYQLGFPHGSFYSTATQTAANTTTAYAITLNTTEMSNGVRVVDSSKITVEKTGVYNIQFSIQLSNSVNLPQDIDIWLRQNGSDIPYSNSRFGLAARKAVGDPYHTVGAVNFFVTMTGGDYVQLFWCTTDVGANITAYAAGATPTRPSIPSVIVTVAFVSAPLE